MKCLESVLSVAVAIAAFRASSETLAWYHFDERDPGVQATCAADAITDSAGGFNGQVKSARGTTEGTDATLAPYYCTPPTVYDPAGKTNLSNKSALRFTTTGTSSSLTGAVVRVNKFLAGKPFGSVTVEAVVCVNPNSAYSTFMPIVGFCQNGSCYNEYWSLLMNAHGKVAVRFAAAITSGTSYSLGTHKINDGLWHHLALVHDKDEDEGKTIRIYVDGEIDATYTLGNKVATYEENGSLYIGGYTQSAQPARKFNGIVDEVRISDEPLGVGEFLQTEWQRKRPIDDDTFVYIPFESNFSQINSSVNFNVVSNGPSFSMITSTFGDDKADIPAPSFVEDSPSTNMAGGLFATTSWISRISCRMQTTANYNGSCCFGGSSSYLTQSWTAEIFFKSEGSATVSRDILRCGITSAPCLRVQLAKHLYFHYNDCSSGTKQFINKMIGGEDEFNDGRWHHVAAIYDRTARLMRLYVDYRLRHVGENIVLESSNYFFFLGANPQSEHTGFFNGWLDEFRLTKRALGVDELIHPLNPFEADRDTYLEASFEKTWKVRSGWGRLSDAESVVAEDKTVSFYDADSGRLAGDFVWTTNGVEGSTCRTNAAAVELNRGYVGFPELPYYEGKDFTAEMFVKLQSFDNQCSLLRLIYGDDPPYTGDPIFAMYSSGANVGSKLGFRLGYVNTEYATNSLTKETGTKWSTIDFSKSGKNLLDGKWHHLAAVFKTSVLEPTAQDPSTESTCMKLYIDRTLVGTDTQNGYHLAFKSMHSPKPRLSIGAGTSNSTRMNGVVDEVRLTCRALEPEEFMTMTHKPRGLVLLVK